MANNKEINPKTGERLAELIKSLKMTQGLFGGKIGLESRTISQIVRGKRRLTEDNARRISEVFPPVRYEWLLGWDDYRTETDYRFANVMAANDKIMGEYLYTTRRMRQVTDIIKAVGYRFSNVDWEQAGEEKKLHQNYEDLMRLAEIINNEDNELLYSVFSEKELKDLTARLIDVIGGEVYYAEDDMKYCIEHQEEFLQESRDFVEQWKINRNVIPQYRRDCICDAAGKILVEFSLSESEMLVNELYDVVNAIITHWITKRKGGN